MKQNITLSLDRELLKKARALAASRNTSVTSLLAGELERLVHKAESYERSHNQALALLSQGMHLGGTPPAREDLYDRKGLR